MFELLYCVLNHIHWYKYELSCSAWAAIMQYYIEHSPQFWRMGYPLPGVSTDSFLQLFHKVGRARALVFLPYLEKTWDYPYELI